jgi:hypothetical protein
MTEHNRDFLSDPELEESVLSSMMDGVKVRSLFPEHFTHGLRKRLYELLRDGVAYVDLAPALKLEGVPDDETAYITDVFQCPAIPRKEMPEAVATLKRLEALRRLCEAVDTWRVKAPHLEVEKAVKGLRGVLGVFEASLPPKSPPVLVGRGIQRP